MFLKAAALPQLQTYMFILDDNLSYSLCIIELDFEDEKPLLFQCVTEKDLKSLGTE